MDLRFSQRTGKGSGGSLVQKLLKGLGHMWGFPKIRGTSYGGPDNKDYSILGSILGSPHFGKVPCMCARIVVPYLGGRVP